MTERQMQILGAVVEEYAKRCEPVSSQAIVDHYPIGVSSATVRNELAELEKAGYLLQPHTSAGRIPSDLGYRTYVRQLLDTLPEQEGRRRRRIERQKLLENNWSQTFDSFSELLSHVTQNLAKYTGYAALALSPEAHQLRIAQIQFMPVTPGRLLLILALSEGIYHNRQVWTETKVPPERLMLFNEQLRQYYQGRRLSELNPAVLLQIAYESGLDGSTSERLAESVMDCASSLLEQGFYLEGEGQLLRQPEFQNTQTAYDLIDLFSEPEVFMENLARDLDPEEEFLLRIGEDLNLEELSDCSLIGMRYKLSSGGQGYLAILGPRRMAYREVIPRVAFVQEVLIRVLEHFVAGDDLNPGR